MTKPQKTSYSVIKWCNVTKSGDLWVKAHHLKFMFRGINAINLDGKGRIGIPTRYRDALGTDADANLVVTIDTEETCLVIYPLAQWQVIEEKIQRLPS